MVLLDDAKSRKFIPFMGFFLLFIILNINISQGKIDSEIIGEILNEQERVGKTGKNGWKLKEMKDEKIKAVRIKSKEFCLRKKENNDRKH